MRYESGFADDRGKGDRGEDFTGHEPTASDTGGGDSTKVAQSIDDIDVRALSHEEETSWEGIVAGPLESSIYPPEEELYRLIGSMSDQVEEMYLLPKSPEERQADDDALDEIEGGMIVNLLAILEDLDEPHMDNDKYLAYAEKSLEVPAAMFAQQVDDFLLANKDQLQAGKLVPAPTQGMTKSRYEFSSRRTSRAGKTQATD